MQPVGVGNLVVYLHFRADDMVCFYVGMGTPQRPYDHLHRSTYWKRVASKHGVVVEIVYRGLDTKQAIVMERSYISHFGESEIGKLVNMTSGGDGFSGVKNTDDVKQRKSASAIRLNSDPVFKEVKKRQLEIARTSPKRLNAIREKFKDPVFINEHLARFSKIRAPVSILKQYTQLHHVSAKRAASVRAYLTAPETRHVGLMKVALMIATRWKHPFSRLPSDYFK